ncbi:amidohydrolase family protein [Silvimonas iriomotensis]|uniref:Amidohydrolase n=1 Tax=Silvimonas iriomotensis TaxID=449662 RepID=A0ABQ2P7H8_9NEIS|nr:amidohydrolase family protein [Silvimonas iriomotensis]GGP20115.1 amidohydrolase [Silvimonas iriomotensis]
MRIDAHQHFWDLSLAGYDWPTPELTAIYRSFRPLDLQPLLAANGIDGTVLVQTRPSVVENFYLTDLAARHPFILGVVGWLDLAARDAPIRIAKWAEQDKFKGVRPMLQGLDDDRWILQSGLEPAIRALMAHGLSFDALVLPRHLPHLAVFAQRYPELPIVIDHAAKPDIAAQILEPWREDIAALAALPNVHCKFSGLVTEAATDWHTDHLRPYCEHLLSMFGPQRLIWGSDWPVLRLAGDYARWCSTTDELLAPLDPTQRAAILGDNAVAFYRLAAAQPDTTKA